MPIAFYCVRMIDYHLHLHDHGASGPYSVDQVARYVEVARTRGVSEIGFTEHVFRFREVNALLGEWWADEPDPALREYCERYINEHSTQSLDEYAEVLQRAQAIGMPVKIGLEVDYFPGRMDVLSEFLDMYPLDFRLGSVHWIGAWGFDDPGTAWEWERRQIDVIWDAYFDHLAELISARVVDVLAHPDLVKKFGHRPDLEPVDTYSRIARTAAQFGIAFELSSAGLRKPVGEAYPSSRFLESIRGANALITTASDAHRAEDVGSDFDYLQDAARRAGFSEVVCFTGRRPYTMRI